MAPVHMEAPLPFPLPTSVCPMSFPLVPLSLLGQLWELHVWQLLRNIVEL